MRISLIAACGPNRELGLNNKLLWHLPTDLKRFKEITLNHPIVMGRKTFESIGKALPKRANIIISRDENFKREDALVLHDPMQVFDYGLELEEELYLSGGLLPDDQLEVFIIGGAQIYEFFLPFANTIYLTEVNFSGEADTFFPELNSEEWEIDEMSPWLSENDLEYRFLVLEKV